MLIFFLLNCIFLGMTCVRYEVPIPSKRFILIVALAIIVTISLCGFVFFARKKHLPIEKVFLVIGSVLGLMYLFAIPMGRAPDEPHHIWRTYSIAQGGIIVETRDQTIGNNIPVNVATFNNYYEKNAYSLLGERLSEPVSEEQIFWRTIGSNPIDYAPQIVGLTTGRILHLPMVITLYLARLCGLIFCIAVIYLCLKHIPILKKPLFFISCLPLTMQTFIAISYDGVILCSAIALISFVIYSIYQNNFKFKAVHYLMLTAICIALIAVKPVYFPMCLLLFFIPKRCFKNQKYKILTVLSILILVVAAFFLWAILSTVTEPGNGADTNGQISFILANPIRYLTILVRNILDMPFKYLSGFSNLEWLNVYTNDFYVIGTVVMFVVLCINERLTTKAIKLPTSFRWITFILAIISVVLIYTALYIQWTQVGEISIDGVQIRYILPVLISIPILCISPAIKTSGTNQKEIISNVYLYSFIILMNVNALTAIVCSHI